MTIFIANIEPRSKEKLLCSWTNDMDTPDSISFFLKSPLHFLGSWQSLGCQVGRIYRILPIKRTVRCGKFSVEGMLAIFCFTAHLNDCRSESVGRYCTFALSLFSLLRRLPHVKGSLIGQ